jgi:hypothetical protein
MASSGRELGVSATLRGETVYVPRVELYQYLCAVRPDGVYSITTVVDL